MPKFMTIVKGSENHAPPPPALFEAIDKLMKDASTRLVGVGGLLPSDKGARARLSKGRVTVTDGPFAEAKEVIGGFAIYDVASIDEAKEWTRRFLDVHIEHFRDWDCEVEIRQMMDEPPADERRRRRRPVPLTARAGATPRAPFGHRSLRRLRVSARP